MNRKGIAMIKMILFLVASLIVGGLVIFAFSSVVHKLMINTEEQIAAKDIGLTMMTIAASPNNMIYRYDKNTENYGIRITQNEVQVKSLEGSGKYKYVPMMGVVIENAFIQNELIIPISLKDGKMSFTDKDVSYSDICSEIPSNFDEDKINIRISIPVEENNEVSAKLLELSRLVKMQATRATSKVNFVDEDEDLLLIFQTGEVGINYYENTEEQTNSLYHKIACYTNKGINSIEKITTELGPYSTSPTSEKSIIILLGDANKLLEILNSDTQVSAVLSKEIYNAIELGIYD